MERHNLESPLANPRYDRLRGSQHPGRSLNSIHQRPRDLPQRDGTEAEEDREQRVQRGARAFPVHCQRIRLEAEGGKGREPAAHPDKEEEACRRREEEAPARQTKRRQQAEQERAGDVHHQCPEREGIPIARSQSLREPEARDTSESTTKRDVKRCEHDSNLPRLSDAYRSYQPYSRAVLPLRRNGKPHCQPDVTVRGSTVNRCRRS